MAGRRRSSRSTNATNRSEQQKIDKALRYVARTHGPYAPLEHRVLPDQKCSAFWLVFGRYAARSPRLQPRPEDSFTSACGRAQRRRVRNGAREGETAANPAGDGTLVAEALAPSVAVEATEAAKCWEDDGHHALDMLQPLLSRDVTAPIHVQEALMHMVLNAEAHCSAAAAGAGRPGAGSSLPGRAYRMLMELLEWHPPAKLEEGGVLRVNENLWTPVGCPWHAEPHRDKPRLQSLREAGGLSALVASAHNWVLKRAEAEAPAGKKLLLLAAPGAPEGGDLGEVLLLRYWVRLMQVDFDARMALMRRGGVCPQRTSVMENSLVFRVLQTYTNWADGSQSKPLLIRQLAATIITAHKEGGASAAHLSPAEVGGVAVELLCMMCEVYGILDRMKFYVRQGSLGRDNDLVRMDLALEKTILKELSYKDPENLSVLLASLPPTVTVRLLVHIVADAASKRLEVGDLLSGGLLEVTEHYMEGGVGAPPRVAASDALRYLVEDPPARHIPGAWRWAAGALQLCNGLSQQEGMGLLVATLTTAGLQHAAEAAQWAIVEATAAADGTDVRADEDMPADGEGVQEWEQEAAEVAALYRRAAKRLQTDGEDGSEGVGGSGTAAMMEVNMENMEINSTAIALRCADRLVSRVEAVGFR